MAEYKLAAAVGAREWGHPAAVCGGGFLLVVHDAIGGWDGLFPGVEEGWMRRYGWFLDWMEGADYQHGLGIDTEELGRRVLMVSVLCVSGACSCRVLSDRTRRGHGGESEGSRTCE